MSNVSQYIHGAISVKATMYTPSNNNSVTLVVQTETGGFEQTLFFGNTDQGANNARKLFFALGGQKENIVRKVSSNEF